MLFYQRNLKSLFFFIISFYKKKGDGHTSKQLDVYEFTITGHPTLFFPTSL